MKPEIKPIIKILQDWLDQLENKQVEGAKLCAIKRWELEGKRCSKTFSLEEQNLHNQIIPESYIDYNK